MSVDQVNSVNGLRIASQNGTTGGSDGLMQNRQLQVDSRHQDQQAMIQSGRVKMNHQFQHHQDEIHHQMLLHQVQHQVQRQHHQNQHNMRQQRQHQNNQQKQQQQQQQQLLSLVLLLTLLLLLASHDTELTQAIVGDGRFGTMSMVHTFPELSEYDLKSKDSKYKRWSPKMDQFLIKLLSDVVHSYAKGAQPEMTKKAWAYVTGQLRAANPETVYSTYTKYSCQQHLLNVNHHRYKIWFVLMLHQKNNTSPSSYSYRWNPDIGRFQIIDNTTGSLILDERQVKSVLYSEALSLPSLTAFNKGNLVVNDFFLSDNLKYMSVYHNEVLPLLISLDPKYAEGLGDIYHEIPKFDYHEMNNEYFKPLVSAKVSKILQNTVPNVEPDVMNTNAKQHQLQPEHRAPKKRFHSDTTDVRNIDLELTSKNLMGKDPHETALLDSNDRKPRNTIVRHQQLQQPSNQQRHQLQHQELQLQHNSLQQVDDSVDPDLKRPRNANTIQESNNNALDYETLATAAIAAINSPPVTNGRDSLPFYIKDRKWFNKLIALHESGHIVVDEVLSICEGVRDGKIPLFMLNVLDQTYYPTRNNTGAPSEELPDKEMVKRIREFMLPMVYNV